MGQMYDLVDASWKAVERSCAKDVDSHLLLGDERVGRTRLAVTRIEPGGTFGPHVDDYRHVICVLGGRGELRVGRHRRSVGPGTVMLTDPGEPHAMWASDDEALLLVVANVYADEPTAA